MLNKILIYIGVEAIISALFFVQASDPIITKYGINLNYLAALVVCTPILWLLDWAVREFIATFKTVS